ncbi:hypothetical protein FRX31_027088 [Thalictrum thalictroides]|uniref:Uncharacterized protein n=1 Tax=Thalictrum thalictroides TaxID=46969 RepID=A0A7J6VE11_THATH|nr:hypothetical protein FRX31_027088 [Thalictrum thalictroides]
MEENRGKFLEIEKLLFWQIKFQYSRSSNSPFSSNLLLNEEFSEEKGLLNLEVEFCTEFEFCAEEQSNRGNLFESFLD